MFGWEFPPYQAGGLATATLGLVKGLLSQGMAVTLVVPFPVDGSEIPDLRLVSATPFTQQLKEIRVPSPVAPYGTEEDYVASWQRVTTGAPLGVTGGVYGRNLFAEVERLAAVAGDIARVEPHDVIDVHDWITYGAGIQARAASGKPLVAHIHATEYDRSGDWVNEEIVRREREGMLAADAVIANSHVLKRQVVERYRIPAAKVAVVHWGIDPDRDEWTEHHDPLAAADSPLVLFLGRVTRQKGPDYFIEIARRVTDFVPNARFVVAGTGDLLPRVIERSVELGLAERVHFAGPLAGAEVERAFRLAKVCVMPSVSEPFGLVALESLRAGTPCILPKGSGAAEVVRHALRADFWDIDEMTNQIVSVLRHDPLHQELRENGRREVGDPRFSLEEPARLTAGVYTHSQSRR